MRNAGFAVLAALNMAACSSITAPDAVQFTSAGASISINVPLNAIAVRGLTLNFKGTASVESLQIMHGDSFTSTTIAGPVAPSDESMVMFHDTFVLSPGEHTIEVRAYGQNPPRANGTLVEMTMHTDPRAWAITDTVTETRPAIAGGKLTLTVPIRNTR